MTLTVIQNILDEPAEGNTKEIVVNVMLKINILIHRRLLPRENRDTTTGYEECEE